jgi:hypothetical protein
MNPPVEIDDFGTSIGGYFPSINIESAQKTMANAMEKKMSGTKRIKHMLRNAHTTMAVKKATIRLCPL